VYFYPHFRQPEIIKCTTAASCTLMLQCLVPTCVGIGYEQEIKVEGGTDVSRSPPIESIEKGLIPLMNRMGVNLHITDIKRGYYPTGKGYLQFRVDPVEYIKPI
jgi:RNA 3'-terminal phosphate cyclase